MKLIDLLIPKPNHPSIPNLREGRDGNLHLDSLTRGGIVVGRPGSGKTVWNAMQTMRRALAQPEDPILVLDASGSFIDEFIKLADRLPTPHKELIDQRIVYDRLGDPNWVVPFPFFSKHYGLEIEEQIQRVKDMFISLNEELATNAPVLGGIALRELAPQLYRLLTAIKGLDGHYWQISEANKLLMKETWIRAACTRFGRNIGDAKWYFEEMHLSPDVTPKERELRSYTLRNVLGVLESKPIRARVGYHTPAWTPIQAIERGKIVLISGEMLTNQDAVMGVLFTDIYTQILAVINKRTPHDPDNRPVLLVIDEVPMLLEIKGMAEEIAKVSPRYRSRNLQIIVIIQMLSQLDDDLRAKIWSLGNAAIFGVDSHKEAYEIAQQLFKFDPKASRTPSGMDSPIADADRTQFLVSANWIQHLGHRELVLKRWLSEGTEERYLQHIAQTKAVPSGPLSLPLGELKQRLLARNAVSVNEASGIINARIASGNNALTSGRATFDE